MIPTKMYFINYLLSNCIFFGQAFTEMFISVLYTALQMFRYIIKRKSYTKRYFETFPAGVIRFACWKRNYNQPSHDVLKTVVIFRNIVVGIHCISCMHSTLIWFVWPGLDFLKLFIVRFHDCTYLKNCTVQCGFCTVGWPIFMTHYNWTVLGH